MSVVAGPNDIGFFLSGGTSNTNPHLSKGGAISNTKIFPKTFNNLWSDISERQVRYGHKDIRIIYLKNLHPTLTFKNMRVYWNETDNLTSMQIGRAPVGGIENTAASIAALSPSDNPIPPSMWNITIIAADDFRIVQDFNNPNASTGRPFGDGHVNGSNKGVHVETASAAISNQKIARFTARIRRNGTPQGDVFCKIWDSTGSEKVTMGSVDSSTLPTGTGNFAEAVFTNQTNTYSMQTGDIIGLDYPGATSSDNISWQVVEWTGEGSGSEIENIQYNITGTDEWHKSSSSGTWIQSEAGRSELVYKAEIFGSPSVGNFRVVQDYNDTSSTTGRPFGGNSANGDQSGVHIIDSSSSMFNQKIARFSCRIRRNGSAAGPVNCKVWDSAGNERASIGSVDSSTLVTGTGNFAEAVFTNESNTYAIQAGDIIGLEYPGAGEDEGEGSQEDQISWAVWVWREGASGGNPDNISKDITGTNEYHHNDGLWSGIESGMSELVYKAEIFGPEGGGGGPCTPDGGPGPGEPPDIPSGFIIIQDFSDINAQTGYQVGIGAPNNTFRQAVSIDNTTAPILSAAIARITFLLRRVGNPVGTISCRIWTSTGVVMATLGQIEATSITNQAGQWTQSAFTLQDNTYTMKVSDLIGIEFVTGNNTDHILVAGWTWTSTAASAAAGEVGETAAATDKFGVRMIYPNSGNFRYADAWEIPGSSSSMRWDFPNPPLNAEMTCYFFKSAPSSDTISCKIRGGKHTDSAKNDGCCYILQFPCTGGTMEFEIECPHPNNHGCPTSGIDGTSLSMSTWHGYKCAWWNVGTTAHMEAWQDKGDASGATPPNQWEKLQVHDDSSGNCGSISNPLLKPKGNTSQVTFRIDENSGTAYKWLSIVEIQPGGEVPPDGGGGSPPGAKDIPGTSIKRWNGTLWIANDGGMSDLVFKAEKFTVLPPDGGGEPREDPIIIDPGTKRKPTSYDQGIVFPPLEPGGYKALILERLVPPDPDEIGQDDIQQQIVAEIDATTEAEQPQDPNNPPLPQPPPTTPPIPGPPLPPPPPEGQTGPYASTGKQLSSSTRRATRHYASGKANDETIEKNTKNIPYQHYQCVYFVTMHGVEHDDTVSSKLGGTHMGSGWHDHGVSFNTGKTCLGTEPDHPNTNQCIIVGANIGSILEKRIGLATIWRKPSKHTELWTKLPGGSWIKQLENTGALGGFTPNNSGDDEAQLRIDGFKDGDDPTIDTAIVQEISPA